MMLKVFYFIDENISITLPINFYSLRTLLKIICCLNRLLFINLVGTIYHKKKKCLTWILCGQFSFNNDQNTKSTNNTNTSEAIFICLLILDLELANCSQTNRVIMDRMGVVPVGGVTYKAYF